MGQVVVSVVRLPDSPTQQGVSLPAWWSPRVVAWPWADTPRAPFPSGI